MLQMIRKSALLLLGTMLVGCASQHVKAEHAPGTNLNDLSTFYVRRFPPDTRGVELVISDELNAMGFTSTSGSGQEPPRPVDAIVTYEDHWMWDITMYMIQIDIEFRNPETEAILASGQSYHTSLVRAPKEKMVKEALYEMFGRELSEDESEED